MANGISGSVELPKSMWAVQIKKYVNCSFVLSPVEGAEKAKELYEKGDIVVVCISNGWSTPNGAGGTEIGWAVLNHPEMPQGVTLSDAFFHPKAPRLEEVFRGSHHGYSYQYYSVL